MSWHTSFLQLSTNSASEALEHVVNEGRTPLHCAVYFNYEEIVMEARWYQLLTIKDGQHAGWQRNVVIAVCYRSLMVRSGKSHYIF